MSNLLNNQLKLGFAPTRRDLFSREDAVKYKDLTFQKLKSLGIDTVDIEWLNDEGLLYDTADVNKVAARFQREGVDALFVPHCNFGTEEAIARLGKIMNKPLLLWGPRDESPLADGTRLRDSQCGLFATSKVLDRMGVKFSYIENCRLEDDQFAEGMLRFIASVNIVKKFNGMRIGQIDTRPGSFLSVMCNEAELLGKFDIELVPITLVDIEKAVDMKMNKQKDMLEKDIEEYKTRLKIDFEDIHLLKMAALKHVLKEWAVKENLSAIAFQCWDALQKAIGIAPCFVNSELTGEGLPVVCETDICGAVSAVIAQAAMMDREPIFFADMTVRHPDNNNAELLWHCGPFPYKLKKESSEARLGRHFTLDSKCPGVAEWEIKGGEISICRFDGGNGQYSITAAKGKGIEGPYCRGTYVWTEFKDWPSLEKKFIMGPYIHHVAGIHGDIIPSIKEALRYLPDIIDDIL